MPLNDPLLKGIESIYQARYEPNFAWKSACSMFQALPGLRGFWPMSSFNESGNAFDMSEQNRTLTYNGNPTYNYEGLAPYIDMDGTGDFLSRADEAGLRILGTETYVASAARGLTFGGWFWIDIDTATQHLISKYAAGTNNRSYALRFDNGAPDTWLLIVSNDGTAIVTIASTVVPTTGAWKFIVGRFLPSTSLDIYVNGTKTTNAVGVPASLFSGNASLLISGRDAGAADLLDGRASMCFLCATALSDAIIGALYENSRVMYGR